MLQIFLQIQLLKHLDLIDLQLILQHEQLDLLKTSKICRSLFTYRKMHTWPTKVIKGESWDSIYIEQRGNLPVAENCDEAIKIINHLIEQLDEQ